MKELEAKKLRKTALNLYVFSQLLEIPEFKEIIGKAMKKANEECQPQKADENASKES